jgi:hypothetical protein
MDNSIQLNNLSKTQNSFYMGNDVISEDHPPLHKFERSSCW